MTIVFLTINYFSVNYQMSLQIAFQSEFLFTKVTFERLFSRVSFDMVVQTVIRTEFLPITSTYLCLFGKNDLSLCQMFSVAV